MFVSVRGFVLNKVLRVKCMLPSILLYQSFRSVNEFEGSGCGPAGKN